MFNVVLSSSFINLGTSYCNKVSKDMTKFGIFNVIIYLWSIRHWAVNR